MDSSTLNALLRLCLRLTRDPVLAADFLNLGGLQKLLTLKRSQSFDGMDTVVGILMRHLVEDESTIRHAIEKVMRAVIQGASTQAPPQGRWERQERQPAEFHHVMRTLEPVAARRPDLFF